METNLLENSGVGYNSGLQKYVEFIDLELNNGDYTTTFNGELQILVNGEVYITFPNFVITDN